MSDYPHKCPRCGGPAYVGLGKVDCLACNARQLRRNDPVIAAICGAVSYNPNDLTFKSAESDQPAGVVSVLFAGETGPTSVPLEDTDAIPLEFPGGDLVRCPWTWAQAEKAINEIRQFTGIPEEVKERIRNTISRHTGSGMYTYTYTTGHGGLVYVLDIVSGVRVPKPAGHIKAMLLYVYQGGLRLLRAYHDRALRRILYG